MRERAYRIWEEEGRPNGPAAPSLSGYENSCPLRIGSATHMQLQLDVFGELVATSYQKPRGRARRVELGLGAGNRPQAFSHVALVNSAYRFLSRPGQLQQAAQPKKPALDDQIMASLTHS